MRRSDQRRRVALVWPRFGAGKSTCTTTNGSVTLTLPDNGQGRSLRDAAATAASTSRPSKLDVIGEQTRRRVEGRINGGGTPIEVQTTNGRIRVRPGAAS